VEGPAVTLPRRRTRLVASFLSVRNWQQLARFSVVGLVGYLINLGVLRGLFGLGVHYIVAEACAFVVAVTSNYTWNRHWTFREHRGHVGIQGVRFVVVSLAALGATLILLYLFVHVAGIGKLAAAAIAIPLVTPLNFVGNKLWSFRRRRT
jgi:putative flippase GtrA